MKIRQLKDRYEQLSDDYAMLGSYYDGLKNENSLLQQSLQVNTQEKQHLLEQIEELKLVIAVLCEQKTPIDKELRSFISKILRENIALQRKNSLNDPVPF